MFSEEKAAQIAAYFLRLRGGQMSYLKLMKLMYLADRESMTRYDEPMTDDSWFSMDKGPVLSAVLDLFQGGSRTGAWESWVAGADDHEVRLAKEIREEDDFDELSDSDREMLDAVWAEHGRKTRWELVDYTHEFCPEWRDPHRSALPISPQDMLRALGRDKEEANQLASQIFERRIKQNFLARIR